MVEQISISHATRNDVPEILAMIRELAEYEECGSEVHATEETLLRTLSFDTDSSSDSTSSTTTPGYAKTLILRVSSASATTVAGMAMYFNNYSTWRSKPGVYLEDLYVRPAHRKRGYGKLLIRALAREVLKIDGARLEWSCLKWNEPSLQFYRALGAKEMNDWVGLRVDGAALDKLAEAGTG